jgi:hypothetical protein
MRTATELLALAPGRPLSMTLTVRPARACIFVPDIEGVPWERLVEQAIASQVRVWGGGKNLIVPVGWAITDDEIFWRIIDRLDPDVIGVYQPTYADIAEAAPELYARQMQLHEQTLEANGWGPQARGEQLAGLADERFSPWKLSDEFESRLIERAAPMHHADNLRTVFVDGNAAPVDPFTDVTKLNEIVPSVVDITTTLGNLEQLQLTHTVGRLLPSARVGLDERGVAQNEVTINQRDILHQHIWPRWRVQQDYAYPGALAGTGLQQRIWAADRGQVVVVVGDTRRDFLLVSGLSKMRPGVLWLPAGWLAHDDRVAAVARSAGALAQQGVLGDDEIAVTTASDDPLATEAADLITARLRESGNHNTVVEHTGWASLVPTGAAYFADAQSERQIALVLHEGQTPRLPTPIPSAITAPDQFDLNWMVDVEVEGWAPVRDSRNAKPTFRGPLVIERDVRASTLGPTYSGPAAFRVHAIGLEGNTAKPSLAARSITEQIHDILKSDGWDIGLSDKGAYALETVKLFGSLAETVAALRDPVRRTILDAYLVPGAEEGLGKFVRDTGRRYLTLRAATRAIGADKAADVLATLYDSRVLRRGHILKCGRCRAGSFYALTTDQDFTCVRCRTLQRVDRAGWLGTPEPVFYYELSEVAYQFLKNNGQLPLLSAYEYFAIGRERERRAFDVAFEVDFMPPTGKRREHDIVASWGSELWLGEATAQDGFGTRAEEDTRIRRLRTTAESVRARGVLFVTESEQFSARTKAAVAQYFTDPCWPDTVYVEGFSTEARAS